MSSISIAVHNGSFHTDDVFAIAVLKLIYPDATIIRTRDEQIIRNSDLKVDVGNKYDSADGYYDHHQSEGAGIRENGIPYAASGLIWKHFGNQLTGSASITEYIDKKIFQLIDANDNGYELFSNEKFKPYTIDNIVDTYNPYWNETDKYDEYFLQCVDIAKVIITREISRIKNNEKAKSILRDAITEMTNPHLLILDQYLPWQDIVINETDALYIIFPSPNNDWRVRAVPINKNSFEVRKNLPRRWGGKRNEELQEICQVNDAQFCHNALFIAGAKSKEGAIRLAEIAINN